MYGEVCNDHCFANLLLSMPVKEFWEIDQYLMSYEVMRYGGFYGPPGRHRRARPILYDP